MTAVSTAQLSKLLITQII